MGAYRLPRIGPGEQGRTSRAHRCAGADRGLGTPWPTGAGVGRLEEPGAVTLGPGTLRPGRRSSSARGRRSGPVGPMVTRYALELERLGDHAGGAGMGGHGPRGARPGIPVHVSRYALGELGGRYSTGGSGLQTQTSSVDLTVDLTQLAARKDLELGLFSGAALGTGFQSLTFTVIGDGATLLTKTFTSAAAAKTFFTNDAIDLGSLASGSLSGDTLSLSIQMSLTTTTAGQGFDAGFLVGDPPPASGGSVPGMASAMAGFGAAAGAGGVQSWFVDHGGPTARLAASLIHAA